MSQDENKGLEACRESALRLLERRAHSVAELRRKLRVRKFESVVVDSILRDLEGVGLLDDLAFAKLYCEYCLSGGRAVGRHKVEFELRRRGVANDLILQALEEVWEASDSECERDRALAAGLRKWQSVRRNSEPRNARAKVYRFLAGRGFSPDVCRQVLERLDD